MFMYSACRLFSKGKERMKKQKLKTWLERQRQTKYYIKKPLKLLLIQDMMDIIED